MTDDPQIELLLRNAELRIEGRPLTEQEAEEAHAFAAEMAELRNDDEWLEMLEGEQ